MNWGDAFHSLSRAATFPDDAPHWPHPRDDKGLTLVPAYLLSAHTPG